MNKTYINRPKYLNRIKNYINKDIVKVFVGQRRVGKSYIMLLIIDLLKSMGVSEKDIVYINKEDLAFDNITNYKELYDFVKNYKYIFVDEIQEINGWEKCITSLQSSGGYDIYITGSNSKMLSSELATYLSGRYISFYVYPLDYKEFLDFHNLQNSKDAFYKYIEFGGLPYLRNFQLKREIVNEYLKDVLNTIVLKDVVAKYNIRNINFYKQLLTYISKGVGSIFSAKNISDYLKSQKFLNISPNVILNYLDYSIGACLLNAVKRYDIKGKKIFEFKEKFYFTDIGLRNALVGGYQTADISGILENVVYINLISNGWSVMVGEVYDKEVDFICKKDGETIYLQVAYLIESETTKNREFGAFDNIKDNWTKYVISMDENVVGSINGIKWLNITDFLLKVIF